MPITCTKNDELPLCSGHDWDIVDEDALAKLIAHLLTGYHLHVAKILSNPKSRFSGGPSHSLQLLLKRLGPPKSEALRHHRDGWVFQLISWIAAHKTSSGKILIAPPQARPADKGFDGLIVEMTASGKTLKAVVVCEDKATEDGRSTIRAKVWPEIKALEKGARDAELQNEATALMMGLPGDIAKMVERVHWRQRRRYRIAVTISKAEHKKGGRQRLFKGYDKHVKGGGHRRQGDQIVIDDVRKWMDILCAKIVSALKAMPKVKHV